MKKYLPIDILFICAIAILICCSVVSAGTANGDENPFAGFWESENGSIVQITGNSGVLLDTPLEAWKGLVNQTTIKNIRYRENDWVADEWLILTGDTIWVEAVWDLSDDKIKRRIHTNGKSIETYFVRVDKAVLTARLPADGGSTLSGQPAVRKTSSHRFEVAPVISWFEYKEPSVMSEKGFMAGVRGRYTFNRGAFMVDCGLELTAGSLDYDGQTWSGVPVKRDTDDYLFEFRSLLGGNIYLGKSRITPFVGIGVRYWNDEIREGGGYEREIQYLYSPVGLKMEGPISSKWSWHFSGEYDLFWQGRVKSHLSDVDPGFNDPRNTQGFADGYGLRFSLQFRNQATERLSWYIEPFFRYWDVERSDYAVLTYYGVPFGVGYEPENNTLAYGVTIGVGF